MNYNRLLGPVISVITTFSSRLSYSAATPDSFAFRPVLPRSRTGSNSARMSGKLIFPSCSWYPCCRRRLKIPSQSSFSTPSPQIHAPATCLRRPNWDGERAERAENACLRQCFEGALPSSNDSTMSQNPPSVASRSNYQAILDNALEAYKRKTGKDLTLDPLLHNLQTCNSPDAVLTLLRAQIMEPGQPQNSRNQLTTWLDPTVNVLSAFSATIGEFVGLVSLKEFELARPGSALIFILEAYPAVGVIFTGIGTLLSVSICIDIVFRAIVTS